MDPILAALAIVLFSVIIPTLLATLTLKTYLYALSAVIFGCAIYLWLLEYLTPAPSATRLMAEYGLAQSYPRVEDTNKAHTADEAKTTYVSEILPCKPSYLVSILASYIRIIFVHGLGANPSKTWVANSDEKDSCCWITDLFPDDLKENKLHSSIKLFFFNYESFWLRNSNLKLRATALSLLQEIIVVKGRIILVGHSYGGIVVKKTLVLGSDHLKGRLRGVVFLGTTHHGRSFNRYGLIASYLLMPLNADIEIMRILASESEELDDLQKDFEKDFQKEYKATIREYFYENNKTHRKILGFITRIREFVVTKHSATYGAAEMDTIMLETDHHGLNKFAKRDRGYKLLSRVLLKMLPRTHYVSASEFNGADENTIDADYLGRFLCYREKVESNGYPAEVQVAQEYHHLVMRPIGNKIITCRRSANILLRHQISGIEPGLYCITWIFWFWAGRNFPKAHEAMPTGFIPQLPQENSICERFLTSTAPGEGPPKLDSGFFYPWELHCSVGRPKDSARFMHQEINPRLENAPLAAPVLLRTGYEDKQFEAGYWRTFKNNGWQKVSKQNFEVGEDGEIAFVVNNRFVPHWIGGFSFGGLILEPI